jgi:signal transduction histidine kinase
LGLAFVVLNIFSGLSAQNVDSLYAVYERSGGDERVRNGNNLSHRIYELGHIYTDYRFSSDDSDSIRYMDAVNYGSLALYKLDHGKYAEAINFNKLSLALYRQMRDSLHVVHRLLNLYVNYSITAQIDKAVEALQESVDIATRIGDKPMVAHAQLCLGDLYQRDKRYETAQKYFLKALEMNRELGNEKKVITAYVGLSGTARDMNRLDEAYRYALIVDSLAHVSGNIYSRLESFGALSEIYILRKEWQKAIALIDSAIVVGRQINNKAFLANSMCRMGETLLRSGAATEKAADYLLRSLELGEEIGKLDVQVDACDHLYTLYKPVNPALSLSYLEKGVAIQAKIYEENTQQQLSNFQVRYETMEKELQITALEKEKRWLYRLGIAVGGLLLLLLVSMFLAWRYTVQKRRMAEYQIQKLEKEKELIATQAVLDGEVNEQTRMARDLHDGLGGMLSVVKLNLSTMKTGTALDNAEEMHFDKAVCMLDEAIGELRRIAHNMMPDSLSRFGLKTALSDFCGSIPIAAFNYYGSGSRLDSKREIMLYRIVHELVNNAIKHAEASHILVQIVQEAERIAITVQDNGNGFDLAAAEAKGNGLANIRTRVASYNGRIDFVSTVGEGTEVDVEIPIG